MKKADGLSADNLIKVTKIVLAELKFLKKILSDAVTNFISHKFRQFCKQLKSKQEMTSPYHHKAMDRWKHVSYL